MLKEPNYHTIAYLYTFMFKNINAEEFHHILYTKKMYMKTVLAPSNDIRSPLFSVINLNRIDCCLRLRES